MSKSYMSMKIKFIKVNDQRKFLKMKIGKLFVLIANFKPVFNNFVETNDRNNTHSSIVAEKKRRFKQKKGLCEICGGNYGYNEMQMHHILPFADFSHLATKPWNMKMVCPKCHFMIHHNPVLNMEMMQTTAKKFGVDLAAHYKAVARRKYNQSKVKADHLNHVNNK